MEKIAILTDSTSDIPDELKIKEHIYLIPLYVNLNGKYYKDGVDISIDDVMDFNEKNQKNLAKSSAPSPGDFNEIIDRIRKDGYKKIIVITVSNALSATHSIIKLRAEDDEDIHVVDSKSASIMEALLVNYADDLIKSGLDFDDICKKLDSLTDMKCTYIWIENLDSLKAGGRLSSTVSKAVGFLKIKPILKIGSSGKIELVKLRAKEENAIEQIVNKVKEELGPSSQFYLGISYGGDLDMFRKLEGKASDLIEESINYLHNKIGSVIGVHSGPKAIALFYLKVK